MKNLKIIIVVVSILFTQFANASQCITLFKPQSHLAKNLSLLRNPIASIKKMTVRKRMIQALGQMQAGIINDIVKEEIAAFENKIDKVAAEKYAVEIRRHRGDYVNASKYTLMDYSKYMVREFELLRDEILHREDFLERVITKMSERFQQIKENPEAFKDLFFEAGGQSDTHYDAKMLFNNYVINQSPDTSFLYLAISKLVIPNVQNEINLYKKARARELSKDESQGAVIPLSGLLAAAVTGGTAFFFDPGFLIGAGVFAGTFVSSVVTFFGGWSDMYHSSQIRGNQRRIKLEVSKQFRRPTEKLAEHVETMNALLSSPDFRLSYDVPNIKENIKVAMNLPKDEKFLFEITKIFSQITMLFMTTSLPPLSQPTADLTEILERWAELQQNGSSISLRPRDREIFTETSAALMSRSGKLDEFLEALDLLQDALGEAEVSIATSGKHNLVVDFQTLKHIVRTDVLHMQARKRSIKALGRTMSNANELERPATYALPKLGEEISEYLKSNQDINSLLIDGVRVTEE